MFKKLFTHSSVHEFAAAISLMMHPTGRSTAPLLLRADQMR